MRACGSSRSEVAAAGPIRAASVTGDADLGGAVIRAGSAVGDVPAPACTQNVVSQGTREVVVTGSADQERVASWQAVAAVVGHGQTVVAVAAAEFDAAGATGQHRLG